MSKKRIKECNENPREDKQKKTSIIYRKRNARTGGPGPQITHKEKEGYKTTEKQTRGHHFGNTKK